MVVAQEEPKLPGQIEPLESAVVSLSTLSLLEVRLSRLEYLLTGTSAPSNAKGRDTPSTKDASSVHARIRSLDARLTQLKRLDGLPGNVVRMVDSLRREYPEIFAQRRIADTNTSVPVHELSNRANEVLANSTLYTTTSAHLQTLQTLKIPPAEQSASLLDAGTRVEELRQRQAMVNADIEELKGRSARLLEWWVKNGVVGMGELWEDWEQRVKDCERAVRREERKQREERGELS